MVKYRKRVSHVDAVLYETGMEDGHGLFRKRVAGSDDLVFMGYYSKDIQGEIVIPVLKKPAIKTSKGWVEVANGKHYIVVNDKGERYVLSKDSFEELYEAVE